MSNQIKGDTITTNDGLRIFYKDWGSGQPIVFSHGWPLIGRLTRTPVARITRVADCRPNMLPRAVLLLIMSCMLTGCSLAAAPSFELFGAYFPAWMLCGLIGIIGAAITRLVLTSPAVSEVIPFQFAVCTAAGVIVALLAWVVLFG